MRTGSLFADVLRGTLVVERERFALGVGEGLMVPGSAPNTYRHHSRRDRCEVLVGDRTGAVIAARCRAAS